MHTLFRDVRSLGYGYTVLGHHWAIMNSMLWRVSCIWQVNLKLHFSVARVKP